MIDEAIRESQKWWEKRRACEIDTQRIEDKSRPREHRTGPDRSLRSAEGREKLLEDARGCLCVYSEYN
ncbi:hypothetical protein KM043_010438 [Ampulex compressa]|nr:hypothetical protein KM043_010438 [Ampulex compressa]